MGFADLSRAIYKSNNAMIDQRRPLDEIYTSGRLYYLKKKKVRFKKSSPKAIQKLREKLRKQNRATNVRLTIAFILLVALGGYGFYYLFNFV